MLISVALNDQILLLEHRIDRYRQYKDSLAVENQYRILVHLSIEKPDDKIHVFEQNSYMQSSNLLRFTYQVNEFGPRFGQKMIAIYLFDCRKIVKKFQYSPIHYMLS